MKFLQIIIFTCIVFVLFFVTTYFSMLQFSQDMSSSCFNCSYIRDVIIFSIIGCILILILSLFLKRILKKQLFIVITIVLAFSLLLFLNNYNIFVDRVSSWSSYSTIDEIYSTLHISYIYIIISSLLFCGSVQILLLKPFEKKLYTPKS